MDVDSNDNNTEIDVCETSTQRLIAESGGRCMSTQAMQSLYDFRQNNLLCDAVLRLEDGGVFPIHRAILSACSPYFRTLFTTTLHFREKTDVLLPGVSSNMMNLLLEYAYLRSINVNKENVCQLLVTADYLNILGVLELCSKFLKQNLAPENCISVMRFAREHFCKGLENSAYRYVMRHFVQVAQRSEEILNLPIEELTTLIGADELNVKNEDTVWELVLKWIDHDPQSRKGYIADLMKNIRLGLLDTQFFHENVKDHPYVTGNVACRPIIIETLKFIYELEIITQKDREVPTPKIARPRVPHEILFAIGGWSGRTATNFIESYDTRADRWVKVEEVDPSGPRSYHGTAAVGFNIYVVGGFDGTNYFNSCRCFNAVTKVWREVAPMNARRFTMRTMPFIREDAPMTLTLTYVVRDNILNNFCHCIYPVLGFSFRDNCKKLLLVLNYVTSALLCTMISFMRWEDMTGIIVKIPQKDKIYITGGFNGNECLNSAEMYDPECNQWTLIATMRSRRSGVSCIAYHNCVYAIGGFNGISRMSSGEKYNPTTNTWSPIPDMYHARSNFGIEVIDDMIFSIGGYNSVTTIYHVECYDEKTNEWYEATDMNIYRSAVSACVIVGLPNVNDYIHKHREHLMEEKRQKLLALEVSRSQQQHQQDQAQQNRENLLADEIIPAPPPMPRNNNSNNENQQN